MKLAAEAEKAMEEDESSDEEMEMETKGGPSSGVGDTTTKASSKPVKHDIMMKSSALVVEGGEAVPKQVKCTSYCCQKNQPIVLYAPKLKYFLKALFRFKRLIFSQIFNAKGVMNFVIMYLLTSNVKYTETCMSEVTVCRVSSSLPNPSS